MRCPDPVFYVVSRILQTGVLQIRAAAWTGDAELCAVLADHLHNLPELLTDYSPERLAHYWDVERPAFIASVDASVATALEPLWNDLEPHLALTHTASPES